MKKVLEKIYGLMPAIMTVLGFLIIGYRIVVEFMTNPSLDVKIAIALSCVIYAAWLTFESRVTRNEAGKDLSSHDKFSMEFCAIVKICLLLTLFYPPMDVTLPRAIAGFALAISGILLRTWGIKTLGTHYSHRIREPEDVIETGPYARIRHPAYLGTAVAHAGFVVVFLSCASLTALLAWLFAVWLRIHLEEKALKDHVKYSAYKDRVPAKIIPLIW